MGQQLSADREIQILFNVGSNQEFETKLDALLTRPFEPIYPTEIRLILQQQQDQFHKLFHRLIEALSDTRIAGNALKLLTSFIPVLYERNFLQFREQLFKGTDSKVQVEIVNRLTIIKVQEDIEPLEAEKLSKPCYNRLVEALFELLFKKGFTIQDDDITFNIENDPRLKNFLLDLFEQKVQLDLKIVWRGFATLAKYPNDQRQFQENRILVMSCLIACLSEQLYTREPVEAIADFDHQLEFVVSLLATILFHKHGYFWFQDNVLYEQKSARTAAILSAHLLQIMIAQNQTKIREILMNTKIQSFSIEFLVENLSQSYVHDSKLLSSKAHNNEGVQEFMGLLWFIMTQNKYSVRYIQEMNRDQQAQMLNVLIYYISQYLEGKITFNAYLITLQIIDHLLKFETICRFLQSDITFSFTIVSMPLISGSYVDLIIGFFSHLISLHYAGTTKHFIKLYKSKEQSELRSNYVVNYRCDLLCNIILRLSPFVRDIAEIPAQKLAMAVSEYHQYEFLLQNPQNSHDLSDLSIACTNILRFGSPRLIMALLPYRHISTFTLTKNKVRRFFKLVDDRQLTIADLNFQPLSDLNMTAEQEQRFESTLELWNPIIKSLPQSIDPLKTIVRFALEMVQGNAQIEYDQFMSLYNKNNWSFIKDVVPQPVQRYQFSYEYYAYSCLLDSISSLPKFDRQQCIYI